MLLKQSENSIFPNIFCFIDYKKIYIMAASINKASLIESKVPLNNQS